MVVNARALLEPPAVTGAESVSVAAAALKDAIVGAVALPVPSTVRPAIKPAVEVRPVTVGEAVVVVPTYNGLAAAPESDRSLSEAVVAKSTGLNTTVAVVGTNESPVCPTIGLAALRNVQLPPCVPLMTATVKPGARSAEVLASLARDQLLAATT